MPYFGAHMSTAGGLERAIHHSISVDASALQIFTVNQRQWTPREPDSTAIATYKVQRAQWAGKVVASHASYLINLATPDDALAERSVQALVREVERCHHLGIDSVVLHPGAHVGMGIASGIQRIAKRLDSVFARTAVDCVSILLENTAGQGTCLGSSLYELRDIMAASTSATRLGVCLDTAHAFAAGYLLHTEAGYVAWLEEAEHAFGIEKIKLFHLNDSLVPCGSRKDRHTHIGQGCIGKETFSWLVNDARFMHHGMVLETPKGKDCAEDVMNLTLLRSLMAA